MQPEVHDAEHLLADLLRTLDSDDPSLVACTQVVRMPWPHEAVSVELGSRCTLHDAVALARILAPAGIAVLTADDVVITGPADAALGARAAAEAHAQRLSGRAVVFPGQAALVGDVAVVDVLARTSIETVTSLSGPAAENAVVVTGGFVRPTYEAGALALRCLHDDASRLVPWEPQFVHRCGGH